MTTVLLSVGAPSACNNNWNSIDWRAVEKYVFKLQMRIAKATREGRHGKVKALQWLLTHSFYAKLLAVRRVIRNRGRNTAGVDGVLWKTPKQKMQAALSLQRRGYKTKPLKRIYIPKKQKGKLRPLSIPVMKCRAMQALHLLALEPVTETLADTCSYGFRPKRSAADAIERCFNVLSNKYCAQYILEGDIKSCFDTISHQWLLKNIPVDKMILSKWLSSGYMEKEVFHPSSKGTPQGGIISPTLLNYTLTGLTEEVKSAVSKSDKVNVCIYADDFIITGVTKEVLEEKVKPAVERFLIERGLSLSQDKTRISQIQEGFDFLGFNIRKYNGKMLIKPSKDSINNFLIKIRNEIKTNKATKAIALIENLNPKIRGWASYYRHVVSKKIFNKIDHCIYLSLWQWICHRHPLKNGHWKKEKYFRTEGFQNWIFTAGKTIKGTNGPENLNIDLFRASSVKIRRHTKIRSAATPYDPTFKEYFEQRNTRKSKKLSKQRSKSQGNSSSNNNNIHTEWLGHTYGF